MFKAAVMFCIWRSLTLRNLGGSGREEEALQREEDDVEAEGDKHWQPPDRQQDEGHVVRGQQHVTHDRQACRASPTQASAH